MCGPSKRGAFTKKKAARLPRTFTGRSTVDTHRWTLLRRWLANNFNTFCATSFTGLVELDHVTCRVVFAVPSNTLDGLFLMLQSTRCEDMGEGRVNTKKKSTS